METKKNYLKLTLLLLIFMILACEQEVQDPGTKSNQSDYLSMIRDRGFSGNMIEEHEDHFVVEEDIVLYKKDLDAFDHEGLSQGRTKQGRSPFLVSDVLAPSIRVQIDPSLSSLTGVITDAVNAWNNVNASVQFQIVSSSPHITMYSDNSANCPASHRNLPSNVCAAAGFPPGNGNPFGTISFNIDNAYTTNDAKKRKVLTHELGHCIGFRHTNWQALGESSATLIPETPSTDNNSLMNGGECGLEKVLSVYDRVAVSELYKNGLVSSGTSSDLDTYIGLYAFTLASGKTPNDVVAMDIASNDHCYVWYADGTVTSGFSNCLDAYTSTSSFSLPPGKTIANIIDIAIASDDHCYVWYSDGTVSAGTSVDFDYYLSPYSFTPASGKSASSIVGVGIAINDHCYAWYSDGTASSGTTEDLDYYISPYSYSLATGKLTTDVVGMGIASNDHCYVWYKK